MKMRDYIIIIILFSLFLGFDQADAGSTGPAETVISYFEAAKKGDVDTMKTMMAGSFYDNQKVLLTKNKDYPEFLRNYYRDVHITIVSSTIGDIDTISKDYPKLYERYRRKGDYKTVAGNSEIAVVTVSREFPDGSTSKTEFLLKKDEQGNWKIYERLLGQ